MKNYSIEEKLVMIPLIIRLIKTNFIYDRNIKFRTIKYGKDSKQYYRVYEGDSKNKPTIFFIHGGGWWHGSPKLCGYIGKFFSKLGYTVILPAYRLVPKYKYPTQIEDICKAFSMYSDQNKEKLRSGVVVIGFSAGGELGANLVFNREMQEKYSINLAIFKCFISLAGVLDFSKCISKHSRRLINNYLGDYSRGSINNPIDLIDNTTNVEVLCVHGERDVLIDRENSISFVNRIKECGGIGELLIFKGIHHSDIIKLIIEERDGKSNKILDFINRYGE